MKKCQRYEEKVERFKNGLVKAYSPFWDSHCSKEVQVVITKLPGFETKVEDNPLELLHKVEELMHTPERAKYPSFTIVEILSNF